MARITPKGYYYDDKKGKRISEHEYTRRERISEGLKDYWKEKKETEKTEDILSDLDEEFGITIEDKQDWYHD